MKVAGYIKEGETMFVSTRFPQLSLIVDAGGDVQVGEKIVTRKPRFVDFQPGFAGGELRVNKHTAKRAGMTPEELLEHLRERDAADDHYIEVRDSDHLAELVEAREKHVKDDGKGEVIRKGVPKAEAPEPIAPEKSEPAIPRAARGPGRPRVLA